MQHIFFAFPSDIINTNGSYIDFHSFEIPIGRDVLDDLNKQILGLSGSNQCFVTYVLNQGQYGEAHIHHEEQSVEIDSIFLMCNKSGMYANLNLSMNNKSVFYFVKLVNYPE